MSDLRTMLTGHALTVDLGGGTYTLDGTVTLNGRMIVANNATIIHAASAVRNTPALVLTGNAPAVSGVTIVGMMPDGHGYDPAREGQHAIRVDGAANPTITDVTVRNVWGDGIYVGTEGELAHGQWTTGLTVTGLTVDEIGRHAITLNAADHTTLDQLTVGRVNLAIVDIEPPGHPWGCTNLDWTNSDVNDSGGGFILADKGVGTSHSVSDITLDGIRCARRLFNVAVNPPTGTRRQRFTVRNCTGAGTANSSPLTFRHVDGITVANIDQACGRGVELVSVLDCTGLSTDAPAHR